MNKEKYLYFIDTFDKRLNSRIECNSKVNYQYEESLQKIHSEFIEDSHKKQKELNFYRINIDETLNNDKNNKLILPIILHEGKNTYELKTYQNINSNKNCFLFDLKPRNPKTILIKDDPQYLALPNSLQFDLYLKVLKDIYHKKITEIECKDLKLDAEVSLNACLNKTHHYKEYLYFFTDIFLEYYEDKKFRKEFILTFKIEKFFPNEYINKEKESIKEKIKSMTEGIKSTFQDFDDDDDCKRQLTFLLMSFNYIFQIDIFWQMFQDPYLKQYIYDILLEHLKIFNINLNKESLGIFRYIRINK